MAQQTLGGLTTLNLSTHLDAMFTELYAWRSLLTIASGSTAYRNDADYYFGFSPFGTLRYNFFVPATTDSQQLRIRNGVTNVAVFDSSGNFLLGTTDPVNPNPGVTLNAAGVLTVGNSAQAAGWGFTVYKRSTTTICSITQSGTTAILFNTTSDERLKTDIVDAPDSGPVIDAMRVRSFTWKSAPDEKVNHAFIAQELHAVAPFAVKVGDAGEEVGDTWGVDASKLVPLLVKEVQALRTRVAALEQA